MPRLALYALIVCVLAVAAAVVSFVQGSLLGIVWVLLAGLSSNMAWYYVKRAGPRPGLPVTGVEPVTGARIEQNSFESLPEAVQVVAAVRLEVADAQGAQQRVDHVEERAVDRRHPQQREHEQQAERGERLHLALDARATARARSRRSRPGPGPAGSSGSPP